MKKSELEKIKELFKAADFILEREGKEKLVFRDVEGYPFHLEMHSSFTFKDAVSAIMKYAHNTGIVAGRERVQAEIKSALGIQG